MSTRGAYGFKYKGESKITYNHSDSYPTYLGKVILKFIKEHDLLTMIELFNKIKVVPEDKKPLKKELKYFKEALDRIEDPQIKEYYRTGFETGDRFKGDYYSLLRPLQGDPEGLFKIPLMTEGSEFMKDPLFNEWSYIIDLDLEVLEILESCEIFEILTFDQVRKIRDLGSYTQDLEDRVYNPEDQTEINEGGL